MKQYEMQFRCPSCRSNDRVIGDMHVTIDAEYGLLVGIRAWVDDAATLTCGVCGAVSVARNFREAGTRE